MRILLYSNIIRQRGAGSVEKVMDSALKDLSLT